MLRVKSETPKLLKNFVNMIRLQLLKCFLFLTLFYLRNCNHWHFAKNDATASNNFSGNLVI